MKIICRLTLLAIIGFGMVGNSFAVVPIAPTILSSASSDEMNLDTCVSEEYSDVCKHNLLTGEQATQLDQSQEISPGQVPQGLSGGEWDDIQAQIRAAKYQSYRLEDGGFASANPAHGWNIRFGADGATRFTPRDEDSDDYHIGLRLRAIGYAEPQPVQTPSRISTDKHTLTYHWGEQIQEKWINSEDSLEQWFILAQRPAGGTVNQPLTLEMTLDTSLAVNQNGNDISFGNPAGTPITYNKLKVWDHSGRVLPAKMLLGEGSLSLVVDDAQAVYPLTIDPLFQQQAYIKASNTGTSDGFGISVALSGDTLAVGADFEKSNATGVDGNQSDNSAMGSGAVYVFTRSGTSWSQQAYIKASNTESEDRFGTSVALSGDTLAVGAPYEDSGATGINGNQASNTVTSSGAVYVFTRSGTTWSQQAYIKASTVKAYDTFGHSIALIEDGFGILATLVVGVPDADSDPPTITEDGVVYVFGRFLSFPSFESTWVQQAIVSASNPWTKDYFGSSVALSPNIPSGFTLAVGATGEDSGATGINGNQASNSANNAGAVYVFTGAATTWGMQAYVKASNTDADDKFGTSVALSGDTLAVGAYYEDSNATGVDGNQSDNSASTAGAVYVFTRSGTAWSQQAYIKASNTEHNDAFGTSVALSGDTLAVGAPREDSNAKGSDGDQSDNTSINAGAVYIFTRSATTWSQLAYIKASNTDANDDFGGSVAVSGYTVVVGASDENGSATGINGNQADNSANGSGAVYVFQSLINACTGDNAILEGTFVSGTYTSCWAAESITTEDPLIIQGNATLEMFAPLITIGPGFHAMLGSTIWVETQ